MSLNFHTFWNIHLWLSKIQLIYDFIYIFCEKKRRIYPSWHGDVFTFTKIYGNVPQFICHQIYLYNKYEYSCLLLYFFWIGQGMGANYISYTIGMFERNSFGIIRIFCCLNHCYMIYWLINIRRSVDLTRKGVLIEKMYVIVNITIIHIDTNSSEQTYTLHTIFLCVWYTIHLKFVYLFIVTLFRYFIC